VKKWLILAGAIALEVTATLALRAAIDNPWWWFLAVAGYAGAFVALSLLLRLGAPIGVVYGIWAAAGVALTAVIASVVFGEPFTVTIGFGIALVIAGVVLVETGHDTTAVEPAEPAVEVADQPKQTVKEIR
jgi:small multidrug resistance pump